MRGKKCPLPSTGFEPVSLGYAPIVCVCQWLSTLAQLFCKLVLCAARVFVHLCPPPCWFLLVLTCHHFVNISPNFIIMPAGKRKSEMIGRERYQVASSISFGILSEMTSLTHTGNKFLAFMYTIKKKPRKRMPVQVHLYARDVDRDPTTTDCSRKKCKSRCAMMKNIQTRFFTDDQRTYILCRNRCF